MTAYATLRRGVVALGAALLLTEATALLAPVRHPMDNPWYLLSGEATIAARRLPFTRPAYLEWTGPSRGDLAILNGDADPFAAVVTFRTDGDGFRNAHDVAAPTVAFIGDSFTEAGNVAEEETFVGIVAARLAIPVRNLGRAGYTAQSEHMVLEDHALPASPRAVVWQVAEANDLDEALHFARWVAKGSPPFRDDPARRPSRLDAWRRRSPIHQLMALLRPPRAWPLEGVFRAADGRRFPVRFLELPGSAQRPRGHAGWSLLADAYRSGVALARAQGVELLFLFVPSKASVLAGVVEPASVELAEARGSASGPPEESLASALRGLLDELGVQLVDATPALRAAAERGTLVYPPYDTHLSADGHGVVGELLCAALVDAGVGRGAAGGAYPPRVNVASTGALSLQP